jgi:protein TonB
MQRKRSLLQRHRSMMLTGTVVAVVTAILGYLVFDAIGTPVKSSQKVIQQVNIIRPPTPPPEPEPPPPEIEKEEMPEPEPEEQADADEPPAGELLGLDAEGVAGADGFGLAALKGGRDLLSTGNGEEYQWYAQALTQEINDQVLAKLSDIRDLRRSRYSLLVRIWLARDGRVERFRLASSTGSTDLDRNLIAALESLERVSAAPPDGLPQPVRLRIVSRI